MKNFAMSTHDLSAWGGCLATNTKFCCVFDEGVTAVDTVTLDGTDQADEVLAFVYDIGQVSERNLEPWDPDPIHGYIIGNAGGDLIEGSNYSPVDYNEDLNGQRGNDLIHGNNGGDFISGGKDEDDLQGGFGNDTIWGGDGNDDLYGEENDDKLCDASGYTVCASNHGNFFDAGSGEDKIWYDESENPSVPCPNIDMDLASTAGSGTDQCGDGNDYTFVGGSCDSVITVEPTLCVGAN